MTQKQINIGAAPDDGTGDPLRTAFTKINQNAEDVEARLGGVENGGGGFATFAEMNAADMAGLFDGTIIAADGHRYKKVASGHKLTTAGGVKLKVLPSDGGVTYNIRAFGALRSGETGASAATNTTAIQAAIDAAFAEGGGTVVVPGRYSINGNIDFLALSPCSRKLSNTRSNSRRRSSSCLSVLVKNRFSDGS